MEEKILIKSEKYRVKRFALLALVGLLIMIALLAESFFTVVPKKMDNFSSHEHTISCVGPTGEVRERYKDLYNDWAERNGYSIYDKTKEQLWMQTDEYITLDEFVVEYSLQNPRVLKCVFSKYKNSFSYGVSVWSNKVLARDWPVIFIPGISLSVLGLLIYLWLNSYELIVCENRITGKIIFGAHIDLPVDSVSATSTIPMLKGIGISTSSGRVGFLAIKNATEIYQVVNELIIKRQKENDSCLDAVSVAENDETDKLKKYKELLDSGIITQEEFDAKKKQLLGL